VVLKCCDDKVASPNRCERRLATPIFSVNKSQFFERDLAAGGDGIELSDITD
jgi:hypothetical protein